MPCFHLPRILPTIRHTLPRRCVCVCCPFLSKTETAKNNQLPFIHSMQSFRYVDTSAIKSPLPLCCCHLSSAPTAELSGLALLLGRSREELPALRRDLCAKTKHANRVVAEQCGSFAGEGYAKIERDLTDGFVKLQVPGDHVFPQNAGGVGLLACSCSDVYVGVVRTCRFLVYLYWSLFCLRGETECITPMTRPYKFSRCHLLSSPAISAPSPHVSTQGGPEVSALVRRGSRRVVARRSPGQFSRCRKQTSTSFLGFCNTGTRSLKPAEQNHLLKRFSGLTEHFKAQTEHYKRSAALLSFLARKGGQAVSTLCKGQRDQGGIPATLCSDMI